MKTAKTEWNEELRTLGDWHLDTLATKTHLADTLAERGDLAEAEALQREVDCAQTTLFFLCIILST